jgi:hypothetical protein
MPFTAKGRVLHQPVGANLKLDFRNIVLTQKGRLKKARSPKSCRRDLLWPSLPAGVKDGNWIQTMPGKGYFVCLRLYSPLQPFFDNTWRPSEIKLVQ